MKKKSAAESNPAYGCWMAMRRRCNDPKHHNFPHYGGRGIEVCSQWDTEKGNQGASPFWQFLADMGERPSKLYSIDRFPDRKGDYTPENCRWATPKEQAQNRDPIERPWLDELNKRRGVDVPGAKLNPEKVQWIRETHEKGVSGYLIAEQLEMSRSAIYSVINCLTWQEVA